MVDNKHKAKLLHLEDVAKLPAIKKEFIVGGSPSEKNELRIIGGTAVEENGSTLTPHYMTGNESLNVSKMEKGETNYDSAENKKLEGNNVIYDESDAAAESSDGSNADHLTVSTSDDDNEVGNFPSAVKPGHTNRCSHHMMNQPPPPCDNDSSPFMKEFSDGGSSSLSTKTCDRFGFFMDSDRAQSGADPDLNKVHERTVKWLKMGKRWSFTKEKRAEKLKHRVRKGIPDILRREMWPLLCGSKDRMEQEGGTQYYKDLLASDVHVDGPIEEDLPRTLYDHEMFCGNSRCHGKEMLQHVLTAYGRRDREVQYCQGMNYIASLFLSYMPAVVNNDRHRIYIHLSEEEAFWLFVTVMERPLAPLRELFLPGMVKSHEAVFVLDRLLEKFVPRLTAKLEANDLPPSMYAFPWFVTCLTQRFPYYTVTRVWDIFLLEGWKVMYRVCIALFKHAEDRGALEMELEVVNALLRDLPTLVAGPTLMKLIWKVPLKRQHITGFIKEYSERISR